MEKTADNPYPILDLECAFFRDVADEGCFRKCDGWSGGRNGGLRFRFIISYFSWIESKLAVKWSPVVSSITLCLDFNFAAFVIVVSEMDGDSASCGALFCV